MAFRFTFGGVDYSAQVRLEGGVRVALKQNEQSTASLQLRPGYIPAKYTEVVLHDLAAATPLFGGYVTSRTQAGVINGAVPVFTSIDCTDFSLCADWVYTDHDFGYVTSVTLRQVLTDLVVYLARYGITIDPSQVDGPTLAAFAWSSVLVSDCLRELTDRTGYVWRINASKVLSMSVPGTDAAPYALTDAAPHCRDANVTDSATVPANHVTVQYGPAPSTPTQTWTADGTTTSWAVDLQATAGGACQGYVDEGGVQRSVTAQGGGGYYVWSDTTGRGTLSVGTGTTPTSGTVLSFWYTSPFRQFVTLTSGETPRIEYLKTFETVTTAAVASEIAAVLLPKVNQSPRTLDVRQSRDAGWLPGQLLTTNLTSRDFSGSALISTVDIEIATALSWTCSFKATESVVYTGSCLDQWREVASRTSGSSGSLSVASGAVPSALPSPVYLGGTLMARVQMAETPAYVEVYDSAPFTAATSFTGRVRARLRAADVGVGVKARLYNITDAVEVEASSQVTSQSVVETTFVVAIVATKSYRLEVISDTANAEVYGLGSLEAA